jgi:hypothetical protein
VCFAIFAFLSFVCVSKWSILHCFFKLGFLWLPRFLFMPPFVVAFRQLKVLLLLASIWGFGFFSFFSNFVFLASNISQFRFVLFCLISCVWCHVLVLSTHVNAFFPRRVVSLVGSAKLKVSFSFSCVCLYFLFYLYISFFMLGVGLVRGPVYLLYSRSSNSSNLLWFSDDCALLLVSITWSGFFLVFGRVIKLWCDLFSVSSFRAFAFWSSFGRVFFGRNQRASCSSINSKLC